MWFIHISKKNSREVYTGTGEKLVGVGEARSSNALLSFGNQSAKRTQSERSWWPFNFFPLLLKTDK